MTRFLPTTHVRRQVCRVEPADLLDLGPCKQCLRFQDVSARKASRDRPTSAVEKSRLPASQFRYGQLPAVAARSGRGRRARRPTERRRRGTRHRGHEDRGSHPPAARSEGLARRARGRAASRGVPRVGVRARGRARCIQDREWASTQAPFPPQILDFLDGKPPSAHAPTRSADPRGKANGLIPIHGA